MALLINGKKLETGVALRDVNHPLHEYAVDYTEGIKSLKQQYGKTMRYVRPGFPIMNKGADSKGNETMLIEPDRPAMFPLQTVFPHPLRGEETWSCCLDMPKPIGNDQWEMGKKRSIMINRFINIDLDKQPDLAYYLAYIYVADFKKRTNRLRIDDPDKEIREKADQKRLDVERNTAIWQMLKDEDQLRKMASAYGVPMSATKSADALRFDLEATLENNDKNKGRNPQLKGTKEFLEEMKVTDNVRLRAFIKRLEDDKKLVYKPDGRYHLGDKTLVQVPQSDIQNRFEWLCGYYNISNNADKLQELMRDVVDKAYLDKITEDKDFTWLCKVMGISVPFKKKEEIKSMVYDAFSIAL
jgi:hypothetical protein